MHFVTVYQNHTFGSWFCLHLKVPAGTQNLFLWSSQLSLRFKISCKERPHRTLSPSDATHLRTETELASETWWMVLINCDVVTKSKITFVTNRSYVMTWHHELRSYSPGVATTGGSRVLQACTRRPQWLQPQAVRSVATVRYLEWP